MHDAWLEFACEWLLDTQDWQTHTQDWQTHTQDWQTHMEKAVAWCHGHQDVCMQLPGKRAWFDDQVTYLLR